MKICVIGCGWIASSNHGPSLAYYAAQHPDVDLAACCDVQIERAVRFQTEFGFHRVYAGYREMMDAECPQAVCLLVPPERTAEMACDLLRRGVALLLEKPPGLTLAEVESIQSVAQETNTPHLVAFNRRFTPLVQHFRALFFARFHPGDIQHINYEMARVGRADPDFSTTAVHGIDTAAFLSGSTYNSVDFRYHPLPDLGETAANFFLDCTLASGASAHVAFYPLTGALTERAQIFMHNQAFYLELPLSGGNDWPGRLLHIEKGSKVLEITGPQVAGGSEDWRLNGFYAENEAFLDALRERRLPPGGIETTCSTVAIMEAMRLRRDTWRI
jgi:myo-inositol 2-dehydrogenase / D-chiro-inositol 1-dehydrogenase